MNTVNIKFVFLILLIVMSSLVQLSAQVKTNKQTIDQTISTMTIELQHKILLTDEQAIRVTEILKNYFAKVSADATEKLELRNKTNSDVLSILDKKQRAKFEILKNDWWKSI